jgi:4-amino-4-deoxy-L-arabinose transferase-like glycosyltransferase
MFRFNNPDALLVLLLVASAYAMTRALEGGRLRWMLLAGAFVGFGFLAKELQAFLVLPAYGLVYLLAGPPNFVRRVGHVTALGFAALAAGGWWVAVVQLWPASSRPYIGGSQNNSFWNVLFGYNGFGRLTGNESGSVVGGGATGTAGQWGPTGWTRMFNASFGGQISWLLPAALILLIAGLAYTARRGRTDRTRAALIMWGGWLLVTAVAFSLGKGIIHQYYTVALAPAIGAVVGVGATTFWSRRHYLLVRVLLGATIALTGWWSYTLLDRTPNWHPVLRSVVLGGSTIVGLTIAVLPATLRRVGITLAVAATAIGLAAPAAYTLTTVSTPHTSAIPTAGPATGGGPFGTGRPGFGPANRGASPTGGAIPNGGFPNGGGPPTGANNSNIPNFGGGGAGGGLLNSSEPGTKLTALLKKSSGYRWTAATIGANNAAGYQLATGKAIMAIGGFNGTDPTPTLAQFRNYVRTHQIHYFINAAGGGSSTSSQIVQWVQQNFTSQTVNGVTIYDLTTATTATNGSSG